MKRTLAFVAIALLGFATASHLLAQNPTLGTWKANIAKSKYTPGPAPKSMTRTVASEGDKVKYTFEGVAADGSPVSYSFTAAYDGKDYPITGSDLYDTITVKRVNDQTAEATLKKSGKVVSHARRVVSKDGKVMTLTITGTNPDGKKMHNVAVYEKQ